MKSWTLDDWVNLLKQVFKDALSCVILYGSCAAGDQTQNRSDYNLLVIVKNLSVQDLLKLSKACAQWSKQGNPPPLFFTHDHFERSTDVFPVEIADIRDNHRILFGDNPFEGVSVSEFYLRLELEHELRGKLIALRERFLLTQGAAKRIEELMIETLSTFLVLFKNALRLYRPGPPPAQKMQALQELSGYITFDREIFEIVQRLKAGEKIKGPGALDLFQRYLTAVETATDAIDNLIQQSKERRGQTYV